MDKYLFVSGDKPTVEDENFSRDALIEGILNLAADHFTDGVVTGLSASKVSTDLVVEVGVAYRGGERIHLSAQHTETYPVADKYVFVRYTLTDGSPKTHHISGSPYNTRRVHAAEVVLKDSATPAADEVLVARALATGTVEDMRSYCQVVADARMHAPNTDTHTDASKFYVDGDSGSGDEVLTEANAIAVHEELQLLFRHGLINFQDGNGDQLIQTKKVPSSPNAPVLEEENLSLKVLSLGPDRRAEMKTALEAYQASKISVDTLSEHLSLIETYRVLVNAKRLLGWTLGQIRGNADVSGSPNYDVRNLKDDLIIAGAAGITREQGTLTLASGSPSVTGVGTALTTALNGKKILVHADGLQKEYTVDTVNELDQKITLTGDADESQSGVYFYQAEVDELGFGAGVSSGAEMLIEVDGLRIGKEATRSAALTDKQTHGNTVLSLYTDDDVDEADSYSLVLTWDKPALVDLEEIQRYRLRVYELMHARTVMPQEIAMATLEATHTDLIFRKQDLMTTERQRLEAEDATGTTDSGSTTTVLNLLSVTGFKANTRVVVSGESRTIKAVDAGNKTVELFTPLPSAPSSGTTVTSYEIVWDGDVDTERYQRIVRPGQQLVIYAQAVSEFGVASAWSTGLVVVTDELLSGGKTLVDLYTERLSLKKARIEVERDQLAIGYQDQVLEMKRQIGLLATKSELDAVITTVEAGA